jgi:type II secretory pathway component GspD/PulD (secretin)
MDNLQLSFFLTAIQAHRDAKTLTAPKVTVLSGESATFSVQTESVIAMPPTTYYSAGAPGTTGYPGYPGGTEMIPQLEIIPSGTVLNITPIITPDKKHVLLNIVTTMTDLLPLKEFTVEIPSTTDPSGKVALTQMLPETEYSQVQTRVSVPDGGTLLLGGQKITAEVEMETAVPVLGKLPLVGRLFRNRGMVKDQKVLLILVRPTIILEEEADAKALAPLESEF